MLLVRSTRNLTLENSSLEQRILKLAEIHPVIQIIEEEIQAINTPEPTYVSSVAIESYNNSGQPPDKRPRIENSCLNDNATSSINTINVLNEAHEIFTSIMDLLKGMDTKIDTISKNVAVLTEKVENLENTIKILDKSVAKAQLTTDNVMTLQKFLQNHDLNSVVEENENKEAKIVFRRREDFSVFEARAKTDEKLREDLKKCFLFLINTAEEAKKEVIRILKLFINYDTLSHYTAVRPIKGKLVFKDTIFSQIFEECLLAVYNKVDPGDENKENSSQNVPKIVSKDIYEIYQAAIQNCKKWAISSSDLERSFTRHSNKEQ